MSESSIVRVRYFLASLLTVGRCASIVAAMDFKLRLTSCRAAFDHMEQ